MSDERGRLKLACLSDLGLAVMLNLFGEISIVKCFFQGQKGEPGIIMGPDGKPMYLGGLAGQQVNLLFDSRSFQPHVLLCFSAYFYM